MFRNSMEEGSVQYQGNWKKANDMLLFKKSNKGKILNYRPVQKISMVCKIMEKIRLYK